MAVYMSGVSRTVDTADTYFKELIRSSRQNLPFIERLERHKLDAKREVTKGKPLRARVDYARWIIDCPNCGNAEFAFEDGYFMCTQCDNSDVGGLVRKAVFPDDKAEIESLLKGRSIIHRQWRDNETVAQIRDENIKMGVTVFKRI